MSDEYRVKAAEFAAQAKREANPVKRAQLEALELSYRRLAMQADKNAKSDVVYETPPERPVVAQQQQQRQVKKKPSD